VHSLSVPAIQIDFLGNTYDLAEDDQRFLVNTPVAEEDSQPLTVVINWTAALKAN
jgi:hypothetical protein